MLGNLSLTIPGSVPRRGLLRIKLRYLDISLLFQFLDQNQQDHFFSLTVERLCWQYRLPAYLLIILAVGRREWWWPLGESNSRLRRERAASCTAWLRGHIEEKFPSLHYEREVLIRRAYGKSTLGASADTSYHLAASYNHSREVWPPTHMLYWLPQ